MTEEMSFGPGLKVGTAVNGEKSLLNCNYPSVSYKHSSSSVLQSSKADTRIHKTTFNIGVPSPKSLYTYAENRTSDTKVLVDTERDYLSTETRKSLTSTFPTFL